MKRVRCLPALLLASLCCLPAAAADDRRAPVLEAMAEVLQARYLDAAKGEALAAMLRDATRTGRFAGHAEPAAFARGVTQAMREVSPDLHLRLHYEPDTEFAAGTGADQMVRRTDDSGAVRQVVRSGRMDSRSVEEIARTNFGVAGVETLPGNIGYLKLSRFVPAELSRDTLRAAVAKVADSDAVIVDLRGNIGGSPDAVGELLSPFFPASGGPVELHAAENRAMGVRSAVTTDPSLSRPRLAAAPLYVLTDARTASAAEMFAYAARRSRRATLVGEKTAGAGNGAIKHPVGNGFALVLSEWRILTGPGWERVGVVPDVEVPATEALERAIALAREQGSPAT